MKTYFNNARSTGLKWFLAVAMMFLAAAAQASDLNVKVLLVWGTDDATAPSNPKQTPVDKDLGERLRKVFKWKNYFNVCQQCGVVSSRQSKKFKISPRCEVEITELDGAKVELKLYGEGKLEHRRVETLKKNESTIIAGDASNNTAWFILINLVDDPAPEKK